MHLEYDGNSCQVESHDTIVDMSPQDCVFDGDAMIVEVGACEDTVILVATSVLVEPSTKEFSGMHAVIDVCSVDNTHVIDDEVSDVETESCYTIDQHNVDVHFVNNPLFKMNATLSYDNPLFEIDVYYSLEWSWA